MPEVQGIGGIFIGSDDAARLAGWFQTVLVIKMEQHPNGKSYYRVFATRDLESHVVRENPVFAIIQSDEPLARSGPGFTLRLRVDNLDDYLALLKERGLNPSVQC